MILLHKQTWNRKHARIVRPISGRQCSVYLILAEYRWGAKYFLLIQGSVKVATVTSGWRSKILFEENGQGLKILFPAFPICTLDWGSRCPLTAFSLRFQRFLQKSVAWTAGRLLRFWWWWKGRDVQESEKRGAHKVSSVFQEVWSEGLQIPPSVRKGKVSKPLWSSPTWSPPRSPALAKFCWQSCEAVKTTMQSRLIKEPGSHLLIYWQTGA